MTLQARLDAFKADFEAGRPPYSVPRSVIDTMHRATEELVASGAATRALKAGDTAPLFVLKDPDGKPVSAAELLGQHPHGRHGHLERGRTANTGCGSFYGHLKSRTVPGRQTIGD